MFCDKESILQADRDTTQPDVPLTRNVGLGACKEFPFKQNKTADSLNQNTWAISVWALFHHGKIPFCLKPFNKAATELSQSKSRGAALTPSHHLISLLFCKVQASFTLKCALVST